MPTKIDIAEIRAKVFNEIIPDGEVVPWPEVLKRSGEYRAVVERMVFGKPDSLTRKGNDFVARGGVAAETKIMGVKVFAAKEVRFTIQPTGPKLVVTKVTGVRAKPPVLWTFDVTDVTVEPTVDGNFLFASKGVKLVVSPEGKLVGWGGL